MSSQFDILHGNNGLLSIFKLDYCFFGKCLETIDFDFNFCSSIRSVGENFPHVLLEVEFELEAVVAEAAYEDERVFSYQVGSIYWWGLNAFSNRWASCKLNPFAFFCIGEAPCHCRECLEKDPWRWFGLYVKRIEIEKRSRADLGCKCRDYGAVLVAAAEQN
ncbi:unnamed protein product [Microthlaspi erraticum]|uniref:Uncharacterized protein n=1 Tax=Microthlaspi erraticum TaxID=1685480 RepID=A0A6D2HXB0_9BRAS|nr:unnamed protein product [Microthlaspi erraticum]